MMEIPSSFSLDDLVRVVGMQRRRTDQEMLPTVALFGAGLLVGAGLALLFTPLSGAELREEIGDRVRAAGGASDGDDATDDE
jgi:hypothetical protein